VRCVARCGRLGGRRRQGVKTGSGSGKRLLVGCRARTRRARLGCRRRSGRGGSGKLAGCHRSRWVQGQAALCPLPSGRRSRSCTLSVVGESDRPNPGPGAVDDLAGAAPQWVDAYVSAGVSGVDGAVAPGAARASSQGREARSERSASRVRAGSSRWRDHPTRWRVGGRPGGGVDRSAPRSPPGPALARSWSPEQIANRLSVDFPHDESMRISHEAIDQALYVQGRGALGRELVACLRTGRARRVPRARTGIGVRSSLPLRSCSANGQPRPTTGPCQATGKAT